MSPPAPFRRRPPRRAGDLLPSTLREIGFPSQRLTRRLHEAWRAACDPAWEERTRLERLEGGVLEVGVSSAPLREELAQFHRERLLHVLRTALPDVSLVGLRFTSVATPESDPNG